MNLGRVEWNSVYDVWETPGSRDCRVWVNLSCYGLCSLSFGNASNRKVFSSPNSIFSMQADFSHDCYKYRKHWLPPCHVCFQSLGEDQEVPSAVGAGFLPGDDHSWRVSAPWTGMKSVWWTGVQGSWKRPWWRENWWSFYRDRIEKRRSALECQQPRPASICARLWGVASRPRQALKM